jgi:hypothetical protein
MRRRKKVPAYTPAFTRQVVDNLFVAPGIIALFYSKLVAVSSFINDDSYLIGMIIVIPVLSLPGYLLSFSVVWRC